MCRHDVSAFRERRRAVNSKQDGCHGEPLLQYDTTRVRLTRRRSAGKITRDVLP